MIDRQTEELAIQYVLDELNSRERARFARMLASSVELRAHVRSVEEAFAEYAVLSTRQHKAPLAVLAAAKAQTRIIDAPDRKRLSALRLGSSIAAIAMVSAAIGFVLGRDSPNAPTTHIQHAASGVEQGSVATLNGRSGKELHAEQEEIVEKLRQRVLYLEHQSQQAVQKEIVLREALHELLRRSPGSLRSEEFLARLEDALDLPPGSLDATVAALLQSLARTADGPGIAQVTVMELTPPGGPREPTLAPVASTIISEAFWKVVQDTQGLVAAYDEMGDLPLNLDGQGSVSPTSYNRGRESLSPPMPGLDRPPEDIPVDQDPSLSDGSALEAPAGPNIPALTEQVVSDIKEVVQPSSPVGFAVWDQGSRTGSLSLRDVPALEQGQTYQLWGEDSVTGTPFSIGLLPPMQGGTGRVFFDLSNGDPAPSRLYVTTEPQGGSSLPTGQVVIESPTGVRSEPQE